MAPRKGFVALLGSGLPCQCLSASVQRGDEVLGGQSHSCSPLDTTAAWRGWMGVAGGNPKQVLHRPIPADVQQLPSNSFFSTHPCESLEGGTVETYFE